MADTLESIELEIKHSATGAAREIGAVAEAISNLKSALNQSLINKLKDLAEALKSFNDVKNPINVNNVTGNTFNKTVQTVKKASESAAKASEPLSEELQTSIKNADKLAISMHKVKESTADMTGAFADGDENAAWRARERQLNAQTQVEKNTPPVALDSTTQEAIRSAKEVDLLRAKLRGLKEELEEAFSKGDTNKAYSLRGQIIQTEKALDNASKAATRAKYSVEQAAKEVQKANSPLKSLMRSIGRIAFYRAIRSAIKAVTQAFQEGFEAAYTFSSGIAGEGNRFAKAVDNVKAAGNAMKGQLGSAFISLYAAVAPIIIAIINLITRLADAMSQLFSAFTGRTYLKAQVNAAGLADSMAGGAKAAKEWKNQLMGFDEINKLEAPGDGGGGGTGAAGSPFSFEDTPLDDWAMKIHNSLAAIEMASGGFFLALGLILTLSGANIPLGLALIALGAAQIVHALKEDWSSVDSSVARVLASIMATAGGVLLGIGMVLAFSGANIPLGIGLMAAGAALIATAIAIDWKAMPGNIKAILTDIMSAVGGALLAIGLIITFATPSFSPLGLGLIVAGAAMLAAAAAINWDWLTEMMQGNLGVITAFAGGALLALGLILTLCCPAALPLGIGLMIAGGLALGAVAAINWDHITEKIKGILNNISAVFQEKFGFILNAAKEFVEGIKNIFKGLSDFISGAFAGNWKKAWDGIVSIFRGIANVIQSIVTMIIGFVQRIINAVRSAISAVSSLFSLGGGNGSVTAHFPSFASGGFPEDGLFFANHGEMVGQFSNGKTAVANNQEIVEGIKQGVIEAMLTVGSSQGGGKNTEFVFQLNGRDFARAIYNDQQAVSREHGKSLIVG